MSKTAQPDVAVLGGGPAGAVFAAKLATLGVAVCLLDRPPRARQHAGETLPASVAGLLRQLDVEIPVGEVAARRPRRHVVVWGSAEPQMMPMVPPPGLEPSLYVWRGAFDRFLLDAARRRGVEVIAPALIRRVERQDGYWRVDYRRAGEDGLLEVPRLADASGRSGLIGRRYRHRESGFRTVAITGHWRTGHRGNEESTLIEAFPAGWAWSAPVGAGVRDVTLMLDRGESGARRAQAYHDRLEHTAHLRRLLSGASLVDRIRGIDATPYHAERSAGDDFILLGDAASFLDPLAAHGVHKAIDSGLVGAVVMRTMLRRPELEDAVELYRHRLDRIWDVTRTRLGDIYREEGRWPEAPFWRRRAGVTAPPEQPRVAPPLRTGTRLRASHGVRLRQAGVLEEDWVVRRPVLESEQDRVRYLGEVCLPELFASACDGVPVGEVARRAAVGFDRAMQALEWLVQGGYLEVCAEPLR